MKSLSVVIPTFNRAPVLKKALEAYLLQSAPDGICEILVVDDGSTDETQSMVSEVSQRAPFPIRYLCQDHKGPAAARNVGITEASGDIILFTDSDIVPHEDLVHEHLEWHQRNPDISGAVLGYVTWPSQPTPTPFMRWYGEKGALFAFGRFRSGQRLTFLNFYTCNLSLRTEFLRRHGRFDEEFKSAAFEDIELGYRLVKAGLRLTYNPGAVGYHHQFFRFEDACRKASQNTAAKKVFLGKEAGQYVLERQKRSIYQIAKVIAIGTGAVLSPLIQYLDSRMQLPSAIYHVLFWYHGVHCSSSPESRDRTTTLSSARGRSDIVS